MGRVGGDYEARGGTLRASAAAGICAGRDDPPPGLKGTIAGRRDADDCELALLSS